MTPDENPHDETQGEIEALVIFAGRADIKCLRILKPGFRHCFAALRQGNDWLIYNPLSHQTEISACPGSGDYDLAEWFRDQGHGVIPWIIRPAPRRTAPWRPFTCVEAVKRLLGVHAKWVFTPFQLHNYLKFKNKMKKVLDMSV